MSIEAGAERDGLVPLVPDCALELGRCGRTLKRWLHDPNVHFPPTTRLRGRLYVQRRALNDWKAELFRDGRPGSGEMKPARARPSLRASNEGSCKLMSISRRVCDGIPKKAGG